MKRPASHFLQSAMAQDVHKTLGNFCEINHEVQQYKMTSEKRTIEKATALTAVPLREEEPQLTAEQTDMVWAAMEAACLEIGAE